MSKRRILAATGIATLALVAGPLSGAAFAADSTTTVTPTHTNGFTNADSANGGTATLTATPPEAGAFGPGYLSMTTVDQDNSSKAAYFAYDAEGARRPLADLTGASYMVYRDSASTGNAQSRPSLQLPLFQNVADGSSGANFNTLVFEPQYCYSNLADDTWQTVDGDHQSGGWLGCYHFSKQPDTYYKTLAEVKAAFPNAVLIGKGFNLGSYQPGTISRVDDLELTFADGVQTYDFEAADRTPPPPALTATVGDSTVTEGNSGTTNATFTVTLNRASTTATVVHYATSDGSASAADNDYTATSGDLTIPAGSTSGTVTVLVKGDTKVEGNEIYHLTVTSSDATVTPASYASGTITNDDTATPPAKPSITIGDASTKEGNTGTHPLNFTVRLSQAHTKAVSVKYATGSLTAKGGSDFVGKTGTLSIPAGSATGTISIVINSGTTKEANETFKVKLTSPTNATIADDTAIGTIINDD